jgi:hypothetical protein
MKSFILPITPARNLISKLSGHFLIEDRKAWNRPIDVEDTCSFCSKPLDTEMDEINGVELVCNNRYCPGR